MVAPTSISTTPPMISARLPTTAPSMRPSMVPMVTMVMVARPMAAAATQMLTSTKASPTPTASASMLVATAVTTRIQKECCEGFSSPVSSSWRTPL
ncbi:hypothetical protein D3C80_1912460 [compost metagenome]